ncbi:MAG: nucleotidyltransferase family protein [Acidobacteriia bacterium]|nr:nucleotidyltransferase family protein [Terriglobia bacterium]
MRSRVSVDQGRLAEFCRQNGVRRLAVFGSALRDDFRPDSDVDVLIEFEPGRTPGLGFFSMQEELSRLFDRTVDLHTPASLSRYFRSPPVRPRSAPAALNSLVDAQLPTVPVI